MEISTKVFPVKSPQFLSTPFLTEHLRWRSKNKLGTCYSKVDLCRSLQKSCYFLLSFFLNWGLHDLQRLYLTSLFSLIKPVCMALTLRSHLWVPLKGGTLETNILKTYKFHRMCFIWGSRKFPRFPSFWF